MYAADFSCRLDSRSIGSYGRESWMFTDYDYAICIMLCLYKAPRVSKSLRTGYSIVEQLSDSTL